MKPEPEWFHAPSNAPLRHEHLIENVQDVSRSLGPFAWPANYPSGTPVTDLDEVEAQYIRLLRFRGNGVSALRAARASMAANRRPWREIRSVASAYMTDLPMEMILTGTDVHAVPVDGAWLEVDTIGDYRRYAAMIADGTITRNFDPSKTPTP